VGVALVAGVSLSDAMQVAWGLSILGRVSFMLDHCVRTHLPALGVPFPGGPKAALPEIDPGAGEGELDCVVPTLRIWART
jgi:hypothetical protein